MNTYTISPSYLVIRDGEDVDLHAYFSDAYTVYKMRIHNLGNVAHHTSPDDATALKVMLDALLLAKEQLQKKNTIDTE